MNENSYRFDDIKRLAQAALIDQGQSEADMNAVEEYCEALAGWLEVSQHASISDVDALELNELHQAVLVKVATLLGDTSTKLQSLQTKAKGIMAYVDILPKKISVTKAHKG